MDSTRAPYKRHRFNLSRGPLHVLELGPADGAPLVFLHGVLANAGLWDQVARALADSYRCILLELPLGAHGEGMHADADLSPDGVVSLVVEALDALAIPKATLVGNDSGGALCQLVLAKHPTRVRAAVLTSSDAYDVWLPALFKPFELAAFIPGALYLVAKLLQLRFIRGLPFALGWLARRLPEETAKSFVKPMSESSGVRRDVAKFLRGISPKLTQRAALQFSAFKGPVLLAWSREDRFFPMRLAERLLADFPNAELAVLDDAYTFSPIDQPAPLALRMRTFLEAQS